MNKKDRKLLKGLIARNNRDVTFLGLEALEDPTISRKAKRFILMMLLRRAGAWTLQHFLKYSEEMKKEVSTKVTKVKVSKKTIEVKDEKELADKIIEIVKEAIKD